MRVNQIQQAQKMPYQQSFSANGKAIYGAPIGLGSVITLESINILANGKSLLGNTVDNTNVTGLLTCIVVGLASVLFGIDGALFGNKYLKKLRDKLFG